MSIWMLNISNDCKSSMSSENYPFTFFMVTYICPDRFVKVYQASKRLSASQSHSCRKAESQYGKIFYVPQPSLASKVTLGVPMSCNLIICKRKEVQPLAALDSKQKISLSLM